MPVNPVWRTCESFTVLEVAYLLADIEPEPVYEPMPPAAIAALKGILRFVRYGKAAAFLDRHALKSKPFHSVSFLDACERVLDKAERIQPGFFRRCEWLTYPAEEALYAGAPLYAELFNQYTIERQECSEVARDMSVQPEFLETDDDAAKMNADSVNGILSFTTPAGTKWSDIRCIIRNNGYSEMLEIQGPGGQKNYNPWELGFREQGKSKSRDKISGGKLWNSFVDFAKGCGEVQGNKHWSPQKHDVSRLRKLLGQIFPDIEGRPISDYKNGCWKAAFHIELSVYTEED